VSALQRASSVSAPHASGVTQTPAGQVAPGGHSDVTARHSHPAAAPHASALPLAPHASLTIAAGTG
jgi:hypothetical protein